MSEYTPSTRRVRATYIHGAMGTTNHDGKAELLREQFDRWLEITLQKTQIAERERIIANILERVRDLRSCTKNDNCNELGELINSYIPEWTEGENE